MVESQQNLKPARFLQGVGECHLSSARQPGKNVVNDFNSKGARHEQIQLL